MEIVEETTIAAPLERVFAALTSAGELAQWWTEKGVCTATHWAIDARVNGTWISRWRWEDGREFEIGGTIREIVPPRLLVYDWWDTRYPDVPRTIVRYELTPVAGGTHVRVTHSGFSPARDDLADYGGGWSRVLEKLSEYIPR